MSNMSYDRWKGQRGPQQARGTGSGSISGGPAASTGEAGTVANYGSSSNETFHRQQLAREAAARRDYAQAGRLPGETSSGNRAAQNQALSAQPGVKTPQQLQDEYRKAQQGGYGDHWLRANVNAVQQAGGYWQPNQNPAMTMGGLQPGARGQSSVLKGSNLNMGGIAAYQNANPAMQAYMQSQGMAPQISQWSIGSGSQQAGTGGAGGYRAANTIGGQLNPLQAQAAARRMQAGSAPGVQGFGQSAGFPGGAPGGGHPLYGQVSGAISQGIGGPGGGTPGRTLDFGRGIGGKRMIQSTPQRAGGSTLPVEAIQAQIGENIGAQAAAQQKSIREDFARRGQSGTPAEAAAIRAAESGAGRERNSLQRDLMVADSAAGREDRYRYSQLGANFLRGEQSGQLGALRNYLGAYGG